MLSSVASRMFNGVRFCVYSNDHSPRHVHAVLGKTRVIIDLLPNGDIRLSDRPRPISPSNAKRSDIRKALRLAKEHFEELAALWESIYGGS
jgi:hypothetical protein